MAKRERMKKAKADQWMNLEPLWWMTENVSHSTQDANLIFNDLQIAKRAHEIAAAPAASPSREAKA